jgi:homoserine O-acetyltransferase
LCGWRAQIVALTMDPLFQNGDYEEQPKKGVEAFSPVWTVWLFSQE